MMLSKKPHLMIGRITEFLVTGKLSPLDYKIQSPRGLKIYELGGVGLGIVAALDKSNGTNSVGHEILAKYAISSPNSNRSIPIPSLNFGKNCDTWVKGGVDLEMVSQNCESYTYVTCHGPDNKCITFDGCECTKVGHERNKIGVDRRCRDELGGVSVAKQYKASNTEDVSWYPTSDFLSSCHLCKKNLHGKDIYIYRGEKAFCSIECRAREMMREERNERCRSEVVWRSNEVSRYSNYTTNSMFSTGILAI